MVHVGCGDASLTAQLRVNNSYIVQGLNQNAAEVKEARTALTDAGIYGDVSVVEWTGSSLPYVDGLVNLVVVTDPATAVPASEIARVLAPRGVAIGPAGAVCIPQPASPVGNGRVRYQKPVPSAIDEWTHYLHDPSNNAVSQDTEIHPPKHLQWVGSPRYSRHHDHMSAMSACVTANGRIYHIMDEASRLSIYLQPEWKLVARDAFNGTLLWKRDIDVWYNHMQRLKSGPAFLPRKLVADGDTLYAAPGIHAPAMAIDGATGKPLQTYVPDMACDEIMHSDGTLFLVGAAPDAEEDSVDARAIKGTASRRIVAVNAADGEILWTVESKVLALTLTLDQDHVYFHDAEAIVCLDRKTGDKTWTSKPMAYFENMLPEFAPTMVVYKDVLFFAGGEGYVAHRSSRDMMYAISTKDGRTLWSAEHPPSGYKSPEDLLVVDGLVWCAETTSGRQSGELIGRDPWTGEEKKRFPPNVETYWFHHRCYRARATEKYFLMSRTGVEFVDHENENWIINHWVRGACLYGIMPANGFTYAPQHPCACYPEAKLSGFNALSSHRILPAADQESPRLIKGPAYGKVGSARVASPSEWPTFRHDAARSNHARTTVPGELKRAWRTKIAGDSHPGSTIADKISQPVVAGGRVFLTAVNQHTVLALDEATGETLWRFTAGGRVDSAPTIYKGTAIFGCNDGWVYCLRADDGVLVWRFRAAPQDARICAFEQVESAWPVPGNVLVVDDTAYFVAGRSIFLDGGLRIYRLNAVTGELLSETVMDDRDPDGKKIQDYIEWLNMPVGLPDVLSSDGSRIYMRSQPFTMDGKRVRVDRIEVEQQTGEEAHLFCPSGFLDGSWWHRTYQVYGRSFSGGHSGYHRAGQFTPSGKIMSFDDETVYAFGRKPQFYKWTTPIEHELYAATRVLTLAPAPPKPAKTGPSTTIDIANSASLDPTGIPFTVAAWVNAKTPNGVVLARGGPANGYALLLEQGRLEFDIRTDGGLFKAVARDKLPQGQWVHVAGVLGDDNQMAVYVNGKPVGQGKAYGPISATPIQSMQIGADVDGSVGDYPSPSVFKGSIDEVRIYHGVVTAAEVLAMAGDSKAVAVADAKLVLHCPFDNGKARDVSGNGNHGNVKAAKPAEGRFGRAMRFTGAALGTGQKRGKGGPRSRYVRQWTQDLPLFARAMVRTEDMLVVAGPRDIIDETKVGKLLASPEMQQQMAEQSRMLAGKSGGLLWLVSPKTGERLGTYTMASPPIFDGMVAANGKLYISTMDGAVICLDGE